MKCINRSNGLCRAIRWKFELWKRRTRGSGSKWSDKQRVLWAQPCNQTYEEAIRGRIRERKFRMNFMVRRPMDLHGSP